jgi:hypothetical protein
MTERVLVRERAPAALSCPPTGRKARSVPLQASMTRAAMTRASGLLTSQARTSAV